jgi:hypothetical protein
LCFGKSFFANSTLSVENGTFRTFTVDVWNYAEGFRLFRPEKGMWDKTFITKILIEARHLFYIHFNSVFWRLAEVHRSSMKDFYKWA